SAGDISARLKIRPRYMMAMMIAAKNKPPHPPAPMPRFHPEKCPEMTAPTPSAHSDQTRAYRLRPRFSKYSWPAFLYVTLPMRFLSAMRSFVRLFFRAVFDEHTILVRDSRERSLTRPSDPLLLS